MRRQISLKWLVTLSFLGLAVVVVVGYSLLSANFFIRGMDNIVADNMAKVVASYVESVPSAQRKRLNHFSGYQIGQDWSQMPEKVRSAFEMPVRNYVMFKHDDADWLSRPDEILFVMRVAHAGETYFISSSLTRDTASPLVGRNAKKSIRLLLVLSAATLATLAAVVWLLFKQVARPVNALGQWARELDENNLQETPPDFYYPELNDLAALIRNSLSSVQESLEREHRFLRHSSHELRTPISVIRNNVELLHKLEATSDKKRERREVQAIQRIDRASLTMKHLTETLLWLSRESEAAPRRVEFDLERLILDLVAEARYLLKDKGVEIVVETEPHTVAAAEIPARIVLGNLIRNAFQHTWQGAVRIVQKGGSVEIVNDAEEEVPENRDLGFGLGLQLTDQLTRKLKWSYSAESQPGLHRTQVAIENPSTPKTLPSPIPD